MFFKSASVTFFLSLTSLLTFPQNILIPWPEITDSSEYVDTRTVPISFTDHQTVFLDTLDIWMSTEFPGSRVNGFKQTNDSTLELIIRPENTPINMSPWYAFRLWSPTNKTVYIRLLYKHGTHRYPPRISPDGIEWTKMDPSEIHVNDEDSSAVFKILLPQEARWISAQELISSQDTYQWIHTLSAKPIVQNKIIGYSHRGKPILAMDIGLEKKENVLVILSRQHPPEVTGYLEMVSFVETLCGKERIAKKFRKRFRILVLPLMNPDGVDQGHWRHNSGGIDLNRDWRFFNQPETFAFRKFIIEEVDTSQAKLWFAIDFHSTQTDLFYLHKEENMPDGKTIALEWVHDINAQFPNNTFSPEPTGVTAQISKNWFMHELHSEAVTYEVGDQTDRDVIRDRGRYAALALMKILLKKIH